jgi:2-methylisocitrate lyase-like PEP mutase family enzyme
MSWAFGRADAHGIRREDMVAATARIVQAVRIPVSADIEGGYGLSPREVGETVRAIIGVGAVGINLEDTPGGPGQPICSASDQARRIQAACSAASGAGVDLFINARTDVFLFRIGRVERRLADVLNRAATYHAAGADCLFVPGVVEVATIKELAGGPLPLNVMAGPGAPPVAELAMAGAIRVSVGTAIAQSAYQLVAEAASELLTRGTYLSFSAAMEYGNLNHLLSG